MAELQEIGRNAINHAEKLGADEAELYLYTENQTSVKFVGGIFASRGGAVKGIKGTFVKIAEPWIKKKGIPLITSGTKAGVGIRAVVKKAIGFSSVSSIEPKKVLESIEEAVKIAKIRPPDPNWVSFSEPKKSAASSGVFDKKMLDLGIERVLNLCSDCCVTAGDYDKRIKQAMTMMSTRSFSFCVVNTRGVGAYDEGTLFSAFIGTKAKSGSEEVSGGDFLMSRSFTEDLSNIALNASRSAIESFGKKPLREKFVGDVVFENTSWMELFSTIFDSGISASNVQENRSVLKDKVGKSIAEGEISIVDDGTLSEGLWTSRIDDEGVPRQKTPIVEKGVLSGFLYDNYAGKREGRESTGNARRRFLFGSPAYARQPAVSPSNLMLMPGKGGLDALISEVENGVLVRGELIGAGHSNVVTGDFSVTADNAFKIEHGAVAYPLKACTVAGNLYDALNSVVAVGNDVRGYWNVLCPSIVVDKIVVST